jgi:hypothetical protein
VLALASVASAQTLTGFRDKGIDSQPQSVDCKTSRYSFAAPPTTIQGRCCHSPTVLIFGHIGTEQDIEDLKRAPNRLEFFPNDIAAKGISQSPKRVAAPKCRSPNRFGGGGEEAVTPSDRGTVLFSCIAPEYT